MGWGLEFLKRFTQLEDRGAEPQRRGVAGRYRRRLVMESLEDRRLLTTGLMPGGFSLPGHGPTLADLPVAAQHAISSAIDQNQLSYSAAAGASNNPFLQVAKLTASDGAAGDNFGNSVAISGNTVVVGCLSPQWTATAARAPCMCSPSRPPVGRT